MASRVAFASAGEPPVSCARTKRLPLVRASAPTLGSSNTTRSNASAGRSSADGMPILVVTRLLMVPE